MFALNRPEYVNVEGGGLNASPPPDKCTRPFVTRDFVLSTFSTDTRPVDRFDRSIHGRDAPVKPSSRCSLSLQSAAARFFYLKFCRRHFESADALTDYACKRYLLSDRKDVHFEAEKCVFKEDYIFLFF